MKYISEEDLRAYLINDGCDDGCGYLDERDIPSLPWIELDEDEKVRHWILVSERLPEDKQSVLVWCPEYKNMYCAYLNNKNWWLFGAFCQIAPNAVIAWMPLPEPYKAERSDKE